MRSLIPLMLLFLSFSSKAQNAYMENQTTDTNYTIRLFYPIGGEMYNQKTLTDIVDSTKFRIYIDTLCLHGYSGRNSGAITGNLLWMKGYNMLSSPPSNLSIAYSQLTSVPSLQPQLNGTGFIKATGTTISYDNSTYLTAEVDGSITNELAPVATMTMYGGSSAPTGYLLCDGSAVSRTTYAALFAIIGTTYGVGDGSTTFNLPDLRQRFPLGKSASGTGQNLGETGGNIDHTHTVDPPNTTSTASVNINNVTLLALGSAASPSHTHDVNITQFNSGASNPPYISLNFIIKY